MNSPTLAPPSLRLWPGVLLVALQWLLRFVVPALVPDAMPVAVIGGLGLGVAVILWWIFFSRAPWRERLGLTVVIAAAITGTLRLVHPSISGGMMGLMLFVYVAPGLSLALVAAVALTRHRPVATRRIVMVAAVLFSCVIWTAVRTGGFSSGLNHDWAWRWTPTPEDQLVAQASARAPAVRPAPAPVLPSSKISVATWPGFRGAGRDSILHGVKLETNWATHPPAELWRQPVGPGWSSFAVSDRLLYTQEQRGDDEVVACYRLSDGEPVWQHRDPVRFWESNAGPGPRGTPTLHEGRVYTFGATGLLNALDAHTGAVLWSRHAAHETKAKLPEWGFSSSPLVEADLLLVAASGTLAAYDRTTGAPRWSGPAGRGSYSSPQKFVIGGVPQLVLMDGAGATGFAPADGKVLWQHPWEGFPIVQPAQLPDGDLLLSTGDTAGVRRIHVAHDTGNWKADERWTSNRLKPYFNDYVVHRGHAFGFNSGSLACIDLADGERRWKGGRYGAGQLFLLADQDVLLVLSEQGDLALVAAVTNDFTELARAKALEGKTWNHPVLAGDILLVRNDREMAAFRLALKHD